MICVRDKCEPRTATKIFEKMQLTQSMYMHLHFRKKYFFWFINNFLVIIHIMMASNIVDKCAFDDVDKDQNSIIFLLY